MKEISKAILAVTKAVKGIDKSMTVGSGNYSYKGVSDQAVKEILQPLMAENGLSIVPTGVEAKVTTDRWQEGEKQKQSTFTEVTTKYLLLHSSGESVELAGYGHGVWW